MIVNKVAVIMSVYINDTLENLVLSVDSILDQSYENFDFLIYIDGPVIKEVNDYLRSFKDERIKVFSSSDNKGLSVALNFLIDYATKYDYKYILRMDSDDISLKDRFEKQISFMDSNLNVDLSGASCQEFGAPFALAYKKMPRLHDDILNFSVYRCPLVHPTVIFRSSVFCDKNVRYPTNTRLTEDMALWFSMLAKGFTFQNIPDVVLKYRINTSTLSRRRGVSKACSELKIRFDFMRKMKLLSLSNIFKIFFGFVMHLLPTCFLSLLYKYFR